MGYHSKSSILKNWKKGSSIPAVKGGGVAATLETTPRQADGGWKAPAFVPPGVLSPCRDGAGVPLVGARLRSPITAEQDIECYVGVPHHAGTPTLP